MALPIEGVYIVSYPARVVPPGVGQRDDARSWVFSPRRPGIIAHSEEEIRMIVAHAEETGEIEEDEREMLYKVFDFADKEVRTSWCRDPSRRALHRPAARGVSGRRHGGAVHTLSRVPRLSGHGHRHPPRPRSHACRERNARFVDLDVESLLRPAHVVPETKDLAALLHEFRRAKEHMAVVVDEYGTTEGIVTLETSWRRSWARSRTSSTCPTSRLRSWPTGASASPARSPSTTSTSSSTGSCRDDYHTMAGLCSAARPRSRAR